MFTLVLTTRGEPSSAWKNLRERLSSVEVGGGPVLATVQAEMREYLGTEKTIAYGLQTDGARVEALSFVHSSMPFLVDAQAHFQAHVRETPDFGNYNPIRPHVKQRNRLIVWTRRQVDEANLPIMRELYPVLGLAARAQARVLLCDGDTMLAFLGAWQPDPFDQEQQRRFRALVPVLQQRLALERSAVDSVRGARSSLLDGARARGEPARRGDDDRPARDDQRLRLLRQGAGQHPLGARREGALAGVTRVTERASGQGLARYLLHSSTQPRSPTRGSRQMIFSVESSSRVAWPLVRRGMRSDLAVSGSFSMTLRA